jgi:transposase InsO family protein
VFDVIGNGTARGSAVSYVSGQTREGIARTGRRCRLPLSHTLILDNGPQYAATASVLDAHALGPVPITTPAYSPESNGLAEAFVHTFKRDYVNGAELRDAETVVAQLGGWIEDYNRQAPRTHAPICLGNRGADQSSMRGVAA